MKAILVIDVPDGTDTSLLKASATVTSKNVHKLAMAESYRNLDVKPMPQKYRTDGDDIEEDSYWQGWDDCIEELEK